MAHTSSINIGNHDDDDDDNDDNDDDDYDDDDDRREGWKTKWVVTRLRIWMGHLSSHCPTTPVYNVQHKLYTIISVQHMTYQ